jgi:hypothetical protein
MSAEKAALYAIIGLIAFFAGKIAVRTLRGWWR